MKLKRKKRTLANMCSLEISLWLFLAAFQTIEGTEITCGLGPMDNYAEWIADERGGLKFPDYKAEDNKNCSSNVIEPRDDIKNSSESRELCSYSTEGNSVTCKEGIDFIFLSSVLNKTLDTLIIDNYNGKVIQVPQSTLSSPNLPYGILSDKGEDKWRGIGAITSTDIGLGVRLTTEFSPKPDYSAYVVTGEAFSNGLLKLEWKFEGEIVISIEDDKTSITLSVCTVEQYGIWSIQSELVNDGVSDDWEVTGVITSKYIPNKSLGFNGKVKLEMLNESFSFTGNAKIKEISLAFEMSGSVSPKIEAITIRKEAFSGMRIKHLIFNNSNFMEDFDKDALQGMDNLETISFMNSKMEKIPKLSLLFSNLTKLKAIYIESSNAPNLEFGKNPSLENLELLSLKGSGPIELKDEFCSWLTLPKLKYLNLRNSNIKISFTVLSFIKPIESPVEFLDVSYTPLTSDTLIWQMLRMSNIKRLGAAGLELTKVPYTTLLKINETIEYLSLRRNSFEKIPEENMFDIILNFPMMTNLKELDLTQCNINYIERGIFDKMPNLKSLFISYNSIENLQDGWTAITPQIKVLDLSYNSVGTISSVKTTFDIKTENNFEIFEGLEILDLSNGVFSNLESIIAGLGNNLKLLSICNSNLKNLTESMFYHLNQLVVLDMSHNENIQLNDKMSFKLFKSLKSLKYLFLRRCRITNAVYWEIEDVFENNTNIKEYTLDNVEFIDLAQNNIKLIEVEAFKLFPNLKVLDLSGNSITTWLDSLKSFNKKLETVYLDDNKIDTLTPNMMSDIYGMKYVKLGKNPFVCGCYVNEINRKIKETQNGFAICHPKRLKTLTRNTNENRGYYLEVIKPERKIKRNLVKKEIAEKRKAKENNTEILNFIQRMHAPAKCNDFKSDDEEDNDGSLVPWILNNKFKENCVQVLDWSEENYTCYSEWEYRSVPFGEANFEANCNKMEENEIVSSFSWLYVTVPVIFSSVVILGLMYWKRWEIKLFTKAVKNAAVLSIMGRKDYESIHFQYHVFVSYSDNDRKWVLENLLPRLETYDDLKVCLHERDFQVGVSILENIMASIDRSQCILLVLSKSFIKSQWCQYEMQLAHHRLLETRREELIIILLEHIPKSKRPKTLQYLMMTKTYIQWPNNPEKKVEMELFWQRVYKAIRTSAAENHN